jgi:hypothetical protein
MDIDDTGGRLALDGPRPGFDVNKAPRTTDLAGRELIACFGDGERVRHTFISLGRIAWEHLGTTSQGADEYEAFEIAPGLYYIQFRRRQDRRTAVSLFADLTFGHVLAVVTRIGVDGAPARAPSSVRSSGAARSRGSR